MGGLVLLAFVAFATSTTYHGHQVLRVTCQTSSHVENLRNFETKHPGLVSFWTERAALPGFVDVQVAPTVLSSLRQWAAQEGLAVEVIHEDLQKDIDDLFERNRQAQAAGNSFFDAYADFDQMEAFLKQLVKDYPSLAQLVSVGTTIEGRDITGVIISGGSAQNKSKIVINGCQHAREWISPMTVAYVAGVFCQNYTNGGIVQKLVDGFEWTFVPIVNGDGYVWTWTNDRLWRKNRRKNEHSQCYGVDLNRNWNYEWGVTGATPIACADTYPGPHGFSEPEETALASYISKQENVVAYIDFHAYGALFMWPWGYQCDVFTPDDKTETVGGRLYAEAAKSVNGLEFTVGPICETIYPASGDSADWVYGQAGAVYSYACELRGNSFILPPDQIVLSGAETTAGVIAWANYILSQV